MSGICGIVRLDGAPVRAAALEGILEPLKQRGPDGAHIWNDGPTALGHSLLATTPEALGETLPLRHSESGCTITADVRLDNRADLMRALALDAGRTVGDGELILLAYLKWREACVDHLLGDFAFAIWDAREQRLFCARDPMGMRQLTYCHLPGRAFVFATEPGAVLAHPDVPKDLNPGRIADFIDQREGQTLSETFYASVFRLPPAHRLVVDRHGLTLTKYWQLEMPAPLALASDEDYAAAFLDVFGDAVEARLRSASGVGTMLSGGLDSGTVTAVAADLVRRAGHGPLQSFSAVGPDPVSCRETRAIHASARMAGIDPHFVNHDDLAEYRPDLERLIEQQSDPFDCYMTMIRALYLAAHRAGLKVMLDGVAADLVFASTGHVGRLLRSGGLAAAWGEARGEGRFSNSPADGWMSIARAAWHAWTPGPLRNARTILLRSSRTRAKGQIAMMEGELAQTARTRRQALHDRDVHHDTLGEDVRARTIAHPHLVVGRERYDRVAGSVGIEPRDPFIDLRVILFCLSLPPAQLQSQGWPKVLVRRAMAGKLPDEVRWRRSREHLGSAFTEALMSAWNFAQPTLPIPSVNFRFIEDCQPSINTLCLKQWLKTQAWELEPQYSGVREYA